MILSVASSAKLQWDNPQLVEVGLRYQLNDEWYVLANADWADWSEFSDNYLFVQGGTLNPGAALDREWKDTWHAGIAVARHLGNKVYSMGLSYDSSPVSDGKRTIFRKSLYVTLFMTTYTRCQTGSVIHQSQERRSPP
jgi:long-subunit fatty acid transport protein